MEEGLLEKQVAPPSVCFSACPCLCPRVRILCTPLSRSQLCPFRQSPAIGSRGRSIRPPRSQPGTGGLRERPPSSQGNLHTADAFNPEHLRP